MRKTRIILSILLLAYTGHTQAQSNDLTLTAGYLQNLTKHWMVEEWKKPVNIRFKYTRDKIKLRYGAGLNFSNYHIVYNYINYENNRISEISPFIYLGRHYTGSRIGINPYLNFGYTFLFTDIGFYYGRKGAPYLSPGADINFTISKTLRIGLNAAYHLTLSAPLFDTSRWIMPATVMPVEGRVFHSLNLGLNLVYRLN